MSISKAPEELLPPNADGTAGGSLTLARVLLGVLEEAAEDKMKDVDGLIHALPQNLCQLCQVLLNMLLQETHRVAHRWLDHILQ